MHKFSAGASTDRLRREFRRLGMTTLRQFGLRALFDGNTTIEEVARETAWEGDGI
jgi:type IV pilus assembly protein PilB